MTQSGLVLPILHSNGTSKESLVEDACKCYDALCAVNKALCCMAPNGRDYYPVAGLLDQAIDQHERWRKMLAQLLNEVESYVIAIDRS